MRSPMHEIATLRQQNSLIKQREIELRQKIDQFLDAFHVSVVNRKVSLTLPLIPDELPQTYQFSFDDNEGEWGECGQALLELVKTVTDIGDDSITQR